MVEDTCWAWCGLEVGNEFLEATEFQVQQVQQMISMNTKFVGKQNSFRKIQLCIYIPVLDRILFLCNAQNRLAYNKYLCCSYL